MRRSLLSVGLVAALVAGCGASSATMEPDAQAPEHHEPPAYVDEPRQTPYDGVTFDDPRTNPYVDTDEDRESTFGLDVDTASYTIARRFLDDGHLPDPDSVRIEEYVNFFDHGYPAPEDDAFAVYTDGGPTPFLPDDEFLLRVGLKAREVREGSRPDAALTFVIDVSGSMDREDRLELVKESLTLLVEQLDRRDTVAIVVYGSDARVVLPPTSARHADEILDAIESLRPEGSTNAEAGLRLGYELAREHLLRDGINRVIRASDGVANEGLTEAEHILDEVRDDAEAGIQMVSLGFGMGNFNDVLLEQLADQGDGFYAYVDDIDEARRVLVEDLTSTLQSVALDARVQVEFDPDVVDEYRLIGYENRSIDDDDFRDDDVEAGAIGAGHEVTALYAIRLHRDGDGTLGTVSLRWHDPETREPSELDQDIRLSDLTGSFERTDASFQLDALVAGTAEWLRDSRYADDYDLRDVLEVADEIDDDLPQTDEVHAFLELLEDAATIER